MSHVFLSYSRKDIAWADALRDALRARASTVFQDTEDLVPGYEWRPGIKAALDGAEALVCLWSANRSDFVAFEIERVRSQDRQDRKARPVILVLLDETPAAPYDDLNRIADDRLQDGYRQGPASASADLCSNVARKVVSALTKKDEQAFTVPVAPFTLTRSELQQIGDLDAVRKELDLSDDQLSKRYGDTRLAWKPFVDSEMTAAELLERVKTALDPVLPADKRVHWHIPDDDFLAPDGRHLARALKAEMDRSRFGVIVIDPVALCSNTVLTRLGIFFDCVRSSGIAVIAIPTRKADERMRRLRTWLLERATMMFGHFEPAPGSEDPRARVELHVDDETDFIRLVRYCVGTTMAQEAGGGSRILSGSAPR